MIFAPPFAFGLGWLMGKIARGEVVGTLVKDLLYGGRNEYLDIVRVLALLGGLVFLVLTIVEFAHSGVFDKVVFAGSWVALLTGTVAAIYARSRTDRLQREDAVKFPESAVTL